MHEIKRVVLVGLSGTGKSTVGKLLAARLNWDARDIDQEIERGTGRRIPEMFASDGEGPFRVIERQHLLAALDQSEVVIATGGGAVIAEDAWTDAVLRRPGTVVVALDGASERLLARLQQQQALDGETIERPLLAGDDPLARFITMQASRQHFYDRADFTIVTDPLDAEQVAETIARLIRPDATMPSVVLRAGGIESHIHVQTGLLEQAGGLIRTRWPKAQAATIITDANVGPLQAEKLSRVLDDVGLRTAVISVPAGETSKRWETAGQVVDQLLNAGIQRNDLVIALGGGVVGDLAGFVAAVTLRGIGIVQIPTSLLAMVDSSVGGKTGINHATGKNLIGAFYQPPLVLIDPALLRTLPPRELTQSWAEMVKHAIIQPSTPDPLVDDLLRTTERNRLASQQVDGLAMTHLIRRNVALKATVVEADEREASLRAILNYGHTIGHAIEASEYRYLHGEAVGVGIHAANRIALLEGLIDEATEARLNTFVASFGLPGQATFDPPTVRDKMKADKKNTANTQTWVLPMTSGGVVLHRGVRDEVVDAALESVRLPG